MAPIHDEELTFPCHPRETPQHKGTILCNRCQSPSSTRLPALPAAMFTGGALWSFPRGPAMGKESNPPPGDEAANEHFLISAINSQQWSFIISNVVLIASANGEPGDVRKIMAGREGAAKCQPFLMRFLQLFDGELQLPPSSPGRPSWESSGGPSPCWRHKSQGPPALDGEADLNGEECLWDSSLADQPGFLDLEPRRSRPYIFGMLPGHLEKLNGKKPKGT